MGGRTDGQMDAYVPHWSPAHPPRIDKVLLSDAVPDPAVATSLLATTREPGELEKAAGDNVAVDTGPFVGCNPKQKVQDPWR